MAYAVKLNLSINFWQMGDVSKRKFEVTKSLITTVRLDKADMPKKKILQVQTFRALPLFIGLCRLCEC